MYDILTVFLENSDICVGGAKNDPKNLGNNEQNPDGMCKHIGGMEDA